MKPIKLSRGSGHFVGDRRLLKLASILDAVPKKEFDMGKWDCGTTACAAGYACRDPGFRRLGLRLVDLDTDVRSPTFNGATGLAALAEFFELPRFALARFDMWMPRAGHTTPKQVAKYIRRFVAQRNGQ